MAPKRAAPAAKESPAAKKQKVAPKSPATQQPAAAKATPKATPKAPAKAAAKAEAAPKTQTPPSAPAAAAVAAAPAAAPTATPAAPAPKEGSTEAAPKVVKQVAQKKTPKGSLRTATGKRQWVSGKKMEQKKGVLYVGHLPHGFYEYELRRYLNQYGAIKRLRVSRNPKTGRARGYAFVQFESANVAEKAAHELHGMYLSEKVIRAVVMKPHLVDNNIWKGTESTHLRILDTRRRREGASQKAQPAGVAYVNPEKLKTNSAESVKRHNAAVKKSHIKYQFNPNVTL